MVTKRLATDETDSVSAFVSPKIVARAGGLVISVKIFLTSGSSLITVQNLVAVSRAACAHVGGTRNFWDAGAPAP